MPAKLVAIEPPAQINETGLLGELLRGDEMDRLARHLGSGTKPNVLVVSGLAGSARALFVALLEKKLNRRILFIARSSRDVEELKPELEFFHCAVHRDSDGQAAGSRVLTIPASENDPYDGASPHAEVLEQRALALFRTSGGYEKDSNPPRIFITSLRGIAQRAATPQALRNSGLVLNPGEEMPIELIVDQLIASGYVRQEPVGAEGEFSSRGGILDVFSPAHDAPHRIEFFGDIVDSIREFDVDTQRSTTRASRTVIAPMREMALRREDFMAWADAARRHWSGDRFRRDLLLRLAHAERGEPFPGWEYLLPLTRPAGGSLFDYFKDALIVIDEPVEIERDAGKLYTSLLARYTEADEAGELVLPPEQLFHSAAELGRMFQEAQRVELRLLGLTAAATDEQFRIESLMLTDSVDKVISSGNGNSGSPDEPSLPAAKSVTPEKVNASFLFYVSEATPEIELISVSPRRYQGHIEELTADLQTAAEESKTVLIAASSAGVGERIREMLNGYGVAADFIPSPGDAMAARIGSATVTVGRLSNGFELPAANLVLLVESDIFGKVERPAQRTARRGRRQKSIEAFLSDLGDLKVGDYVVHVDHGIGEFQGLKQIPVAGASAFNMAEGIGPSRSTREFMLITYADGAKLYVPVERLDLIQRFSAAEGNKPTLDRLGGVGWQKTTARVKRAMKDMAEELLKLYAERRLVGGHAFGADTPWQKEFEEAFEYPLTPDQETSVDDLKADMEKPEPMDRLIVGDVGYGKTEVAMRAAFKAVMEGKQTAILTPTTVLAYQHYQTLKSRFAAFPVRIDMLSRFRTAKEQKEVVKAVEEGTVDIIVGTHRLLSKDIRFKDLGLLIVDEEQRFGVTHKERIKQMRKKVDVIAMSATPIPRTLNMSLAGVRDISVIETPPRDRLAIQTQVVQFSESVMRSAIELELQRGGQVFFVHNRVETINAIAELIQRLAPNARVAVGHGQMGEKELEEVMLKFIRHEMDILVCTTIIENGIDIPLANTIIVNRADAYGLSQLYQLRGRVGRSSRRAYAYLLIPSEDSLTQIARRRLAAIREFSDLGAGFRIAALDLELRGAGNLLGSEQSGHIDAIGFDLYTKLLERTVRELKGERIEDEISTAINLGVDIRIPPDFIFDMSQRLRIYKRVSSAESEAELADIHSEVEDRYGRIPETVESLFEYSRLRREASALGIQSIDREGKQLAVKFSENAGINADKLIGMISSGSASFTPSGVLRLELNDENDGVIFKEVRDLFARLK